MMLLPYKYRPGAGFMVFVTSLIFSVAFGIWGVSRPPLDKVWEMLATLDAKPDTGFSLEMVNKLASLAKTEPFMIGDLLEDRAFGLPGGGEELLPRGHALLLLSQAEDARELTLLFKCSPDASIALELNEDVWRGGQSRNFVLKPGQGQALLMEIIIPPTNEKCTLELDS